MVEGERQFFRKSLTLRDLQGNFTVSSQDSDAQPIVEVKSSSQIN